MYNILIRKTKEYPTEKEAQIKAKELISEKVKMTDIVAHLQEVKKAVKDGQKPSIQHAIAGCDRYVKAHEAQGIATADVESQRFRDVTVYVDEEAKKATLMTNKYVIDPTEIAEDAEVDETQVYLCDHDEQGRATEGGSKIMPIEEFKVMMDLKAVEAKNSDIE